MGRWWPIATGSSWVTLLLGVQKPILKSPQVLQTTVVGFPDRFRREYVRLETEALGPNLHQGCKGIGHVLVQFFSTGYVMKNLLSPNCGAGSRQMEEKGGTQLLSKVEPIFYISTYL